MEGAITETIGEIAIKSKVRLLHTSDWHLGKRLREIHRLAEQTKFLEWLNCKIKELDVDGLIVAGDVFDSPVPKNDAIKLYFDFLYKASKHTKIFIIAGNHDSGRFLDAPASFLLRDNIHVVGDLKEDIRDMSFEFEKDGLSYALFMLPFFRISDLAKWGNLDHSNLSESIEEILGKKILEFTEQYPNAKKIAVAHHLFGGATPLGSEQIVNLSGLESIPMSYFEDFDYVALGHIHGRMSMSRNSNVIYSGAPLAFKFKENGKKYIQLLSFDEEKINYTDIEVPQYSKLCSIRATGSSLFSRLDELILLDSNADIPTYLEVILELDEVQVGIPDKIREKLTGTVIELISYQSRTMGEVSDSEELLEESTLDLFTQFYQKKYEVDSVPVELLKSFQDLYESVVEQEL